MWSRFRYTLRETFDSFRRNATLTVAAIITAAISLLGVGLTLLSQHAFDNLLSRWEGGVEMIVFMRPTATDDQRAIVEQALNEQDQFIESWEYCDATCSLEEADRVLAGEPGVRDLLDETNITTQFKAVPTEGTDVELLRQLSTAFEELPSVFEVKFAEDQISLISQLQSFFGFRLLLLSGFLLFAAVLLIWNTIRTAIFARRREIEVMKLVGATDWFIRIPFMLEGLLHGIIGGALASVGLWAWNSQWTSGVEDFPPNSGFAALVVVDGYDKTVMLIMHRHRCARRRHRLRHRCLPLPRHLAQPGRIARSRRSVTRSLPKGNVGRTRLASEQSDPGWDRMNGRCRFSSARVVGRYGRSSWSTRRSCTTSTTGWRRSRCIGPIG